MICGKICMPMQWIPMMGANNMACTKDALVAYNKGYQAGYDAGYNNGWDDVYGDGESGEQEGENDG